ncbi:MAG: sugar ABC transporter substrate-binding protein [Bacillota bacterium]
MIAFIPPNMITPYYSMIIEGAQPTAEEMGYEFKVQSPSAADAYEEQVQIIENFVTQKVDGIAICTHDKSSILGAVGKANASGIPIVVFNTLVPLPDTSVDVHAYVGYDQWNGGVIAADWIAEQIGGSGDIAVLEGMVGGGNNDRKAGFIDTVGKKYAGKINMVASQNADWARDKGYNVAQDILQRFPSVKAFFACSDEMAIGAATYISEKNLGLIYTIGIDGNIQTLESIKAGITSATVNTDPYNVGVMTITELDRAIKGEPKPADGKVVVPCFIVDSSKY